MIKIKVDAQDTAESVEQIRDVIGGEIKERWGQYVLEVSNDKAEGSIRFITFDWGVSLLELDITFAEEVIIEVDTSNFNPISFYYCLEGYCGHKFGYQPDDEIKIMEQFQSVILTNRDGGITDRYFPKDIKISQTVIQVRRKPFLRKRLNQGEELNQQLYKVFLDSDHEKVFAYYGSYNLKMAEVVTKMRAIKAKGMIRIMMIEGYVYQILSMHMIQHNKEVLNKRPQTSLLKRELKTIRNYVKKIEKNISQDFSLEDISAETGLTQAKLQEGFKLLYNKTVTEYIRHARLELARDYIATTEMNISEVVYSIGFTSRSYFSKIFKEKYGLSPSEFKNSKKSAQTVG
ncbi:AraC family transcriptional regulator [Allomuricauda sp. ARW1Y1]|jgi:AraC-like DNA-binding protein|uniref:helix-turn-helix domain-containing protein n=1 Tax=Allomuricauda sp. ARW1Y1 TaxID=2663843 RepID=UPI0015C97003|nr:AraC family transcriptional regulator [Muricauda sp. ARW1Y1]NYJ25977.1 AraC-like DNA-binding protein [Muricauda sp. ARW1Y1]